MKTEVAFVLEVEAEEISRQEQATDRGFEQRQAEVMEEIRRATFTNISPVNGLKRARHARPLI